MDQIAEVSSPPTPAQTAKEQADVNYQTIEDQNASMLADIHKWTGEIAAMTDAIAERKKHIAEYRRQISVNKKRQRVFRRAKFDLEQIDIEA